MKNIMTAGFAIAALSVWPAPANSHEKHAHESYAAGEPGDPKKPSRTIEVEMSEMEYKHNWTYLRRSARKSKAQLLQRITLHI